AVGLDRDLEVSRVKRSHQRVVELQQRLAAGADDVRLCAIARPSLRRRQRERFGARELAAARTIRSDKVGVAEPAYRLRAIALESAPQIATRETKEHRRAARARAFALQRVIDLLDRIRHGARYFA